MIATTPPRLVLTTDVNGTTTAHNTFAELVRPDGLYEPMARLMRSYTGGRCSFAEVLPQMKALTARVDRSRLETYAKELPLFPGVVSTLEGLGLSETVEARLALSTTGFAGLAALVNKYRHRCLLGVAASPVLLEFLTQDERSCLLRPVAAETDKVLVTGDLVEAHRPTSGLLFHVGDTLGDFPALRHVAEKGGTGIAFCPNEPLVRKIAGLPREVRTSICLVEPGRDQGPDYHKVAHIIRNVLWKTTRTEL